MERTYTINELSLITGYTTRTLRSYIAAGLLKGDKIDGCWRFSDEQISEFLENPSVRSGMEAKHRTVAFDFLADMRRKTNRMLTVLDLPVSMLEAQRIANFFCERISKIETEDFRFAFDHSHGTARYYFSGPDETVRELIKAYYDCEEK